MSARYTVLLSVLNKKILVIDNWKVRYDRMRKRVKAWIDVMKPVADTSKSYMYTLTYAGVDDWRPNHIRDFMLSLRRYYGSKLLAYAWVAEMQARGAVHYHVIVTLSNDARVKLADRAGWWVWGRTGCDRARSLFYLITYVSKKYQKDFSKMPKGARVFSVWTSEPARRKALQYLSLKAWERMAVDMDGWEELSFWRDVRKREGGWSAYAFYGGFEEAYRDSVEWEDLFKAHPDMGRPDPEM